jgi:hypothetical protein
LDGCVPLLFFADFQAGRAYVLFPQFQVTKRTQKTTAFRAGDNRTFVRMIETTGFAAILQSLTRSAGFRTTIHYRENMGLKRCAARVAGRHNRGTKEIWTQKGVAFGALDASGSVWSCLCPLKNLVCRLDQV